MWSPAGRGRADRGAGQHQSPRKGPRRGAGHSGGYGGGLLCLRRGRSCVTSGSSMEFLRPADGDRITCTAVPKKEGQTLSVIQVELRNGAEALVATGTFTFFMFDRKD